jgi:alkylation response protein AidB-like acyl-CoA dehydrogenase
MPLPKFDDELYMLRETTSRLFADMSPVSGAVADEAGRWRGMAEAGFFEYALPVSAGGIGGEATALLWIMEEAGNALSPDPLVASLMILPALAGVAGSGKLAEQCARGTARLVDGCGVDPDRRIGCRTVGGALELSGRSGLVHLSDAIEALYLLVIDDDGGTVLLNMTDAIGSSLRREALVDGTAGGRFECHGCRVSPDSVVHRFRADDNIAEALFDRRIAGSVAEAFGAAAAGYELTLAYLKERKQFGRVLADFQVVQHRIAGVYSTLELWRSLQLWCGVALGDDTSERARAVSTAALFLMDRGKTVIEECIQLSGGIGVSQEYPLGRYYKRLLVRRAMLGNPALFASRLHFGAAGNQTA